MQHSFNSDVFMIPTFRSETASRAYATSSSAGWLTWKRSCIEAIKVIIKIWPQASENSYGINNKCIIAGDVNNKRIKWFKWLLLRYIYKQWLSAKPFIVSGIFYMHWILKIPNDIRNLIMGKWKYLCFNRHVNDNESKRWHIQ